MINVDEELKYQYTKEQIAEHTKRKEKYKIARELMDELNIPYGYTESDAVSITSLYNILTNDSKLKELVSKLKMKSFW